MSIREDVPQVAIYWDFENVHATLLNQQSGDNAYRNSRNNPQTPIVNLDAILDYAATFGDVIINRAYGNWQWFEQYRNVLMAGGVDLIQLFPRGQNMKNSADIRLAIDAMADVFTHPHLSHVVIVSSDSDFISLAQRVKQTGRFVAGIGLDGATNRFWPLACSEFKFYQNLLPEVGQIAKLPVPAATPLTESSNIVPMIERLANSFAEVVSAPTLGEAHSMLDRVVRRLVRRTGANYCACAGVKSAMTRALPSFDERSLGFTSFRGFLDGCADIVRVVDSKSGGHIEHIELKKSV
jgi:hypothetical protein